MAFKKDNKIKSNFNRISIGLASPEEILERSSGEVLKPETVNYRTYLQRTTSAIAVNTRESATEVSYATDAAWR